MNVLLLILKIIGITLLVILGLILLVLLTILFVPLRYQADINVPETGSVKATVKETKARFDLTWLLKLLRISVKMENGNVWMDLALAPVRKRKVIRGEDPDRKAPKEDVKKKPAEPEKLPEPAPAGEKAEVPAKEVPLKKPLQEPADTKKQETPEDPGKPAEVKKPEKPEKHRKGLFGRLKEQLNSFAARISSIPEKCMNLLIRVFDAVTDGFWSVQDLFDKAGEKAGELKGKADSVSRLVSREYLAWVGARLKKLLRHYRIRKIKGSVTFGTGFPDKTAMAGGLLYVMLPAAAQDFQVRPDFGRMVFYTDCSLKGHIRLLHAVWFVIRLMLKKDTWTLIRKLRSRKKPKGE